MAALAERTPEKPDRRSGGIWLRCGNDWPTPGLLFALVFAPGGETPADVPLCLVPVQKLPDLGIEPRVHPAQPLGQVLVDGAFGNAELCGGGPDGRLVFQNKRCQIAGAFLYIGMQCHHSLCAALPRDSCSMYMRGEGGL